MTAEIKLEVQIPYAMDPAGQLPHKFTLSNDDSSYSKTLSLASDCQPGDADGTCLLTFDELTDGHTYTLQCDNGLTTFAIFTNVPYDQILQQLARTGSGSDAPPPASGGSASAGQGDPS